MPRAYNKPEFGPCAPVAAALLTDWGNVSRLDTEPAPPYGFAQGNWKSHAPACSERFPLWRYLMPLSLMTLSVVDSPVTLKEGLKILERDDYRCQYCRS